MLHVPCKEGIRVCLVLSFVYLAEAYLATEHNDSVHYLFLPQSRGVWILMMFNKTACSKQEPEATKAVAQRQNALLDQMQ